MIFLFSVTTFRKLFNLFWLVLYNFKLKNEGYLLRVYLIYIDIGRFL